MLLLLAACGKGPYAPYWTGEGPTLTVVDPAAVDGLVGGQELLITGTGLSTTRTVVIGQRNAEVLGATDSTVTVVVPQQVGPGDKDVVVVTDEGFARADGGLTVQGPAQADQVDESISVSLSRIDCPIDVGYYAPFWNEGLDTADTAYAWWPYGEDLYWCGLEAGYVDAYGQISLGANTGFAGELAYVGSLWSLPAVGETHFRAPGDRPVPVVPFVYGPVAPDETVSVTTARDFGRDLEAQGDFQEHIEEHYYWYEEAHSDHGAPYVSFFDAQETWLGDVDVVSGSGDTLSLASAGPEEATGLWLGFTESEGDGAFTEDLVTGSARVSVTGTTVTGDPSGAVLRYDDWSGYLLADAPGYYMGKSDLPDGTDWNVSRSRLGEFEDLGAVDGFEELVISFPANLMTGTMQIATSTQFFIEWEPGEGDAVVIEFIVYDVDIDDPNYLTEVARLTAHADDAAGRFDFDPEDFSQLPEALNEVDQDYNQIGYWAEVTITRHQLTAVPSSEGDVVVDFVHAVNAPVSLYAGP